MKVWIFTAALSALSFSPAYAQSDFWAGVTADVIGQTVGGMAVSNRERMCMSGTLTASQTQTDRARLGAQAAMSAYIDLARVSDAADVSEVFVRRNGAWRANGADAHLAAVNDPLARSFATGAALAAAENVIVAGDNRSAAGQWVVRNDLGETLGHYRGVFRRQGRGWRLLSLDVHDASATLTPLDAYCHTLGDVRPPAEKPALEPTPVSATAPAEIPAAAP
jgi:hypothetical protein